jgi:hypothetical protein
MERVLQAFFCPMLLGATPLALLLMVEEHKSTERLCSGLGGYHEFRYVVE